MIGTSSPTGELGWLLDEMVGQVPAVRHAVVLSTDGLAIASSAQLQREDSEHLAAVASGFHSLAKGAGRHFEAGAVRQTMVEFDGGFLFVVVLVPAGYAACDRALATTPVDIANPCSGGPLPGIGSITGLRCNSHARAICPTRAPWLRAIVSSNDPGSVSFPAANGHQGMKPMP